MAILFANVRRDLNFKTLIITPPVTRVGDMLKPTGSRNRILREVFSRILRVI